MAGGRNPDAKLLIDAADVWIGVDRGIGYLLERNITPDVIFGDFDSVDAKYQAWIQDFSEKQVYPSEKDETDLELALSWAVRQNPSRIQIYGATGKRLDHELANLDLLFYYLSTSIPIMMIDERNEWYLLPEGHYELERDIRFSYISFFPYSFEVNGLTLKGFKYELNHRDIQKGRTLTISNEFLQDSGTISFHSGIVLVIKSTDSKLDSL